MARVSDMPRESVNLLIGYIYSGRLDLSSQVGENETQILVQLTRMARHFGLEQLERSLRLHIGSTLSTRNVVDMFDMANGLHIVELREKCMRFIGEHSSELLTGPLRRCPLCKLSASSLVTLLQRDSFCQSEASVLRLVREWHAYNNVTQMDANVFACVRLAVFDCEELLKLNFEVRKESLRIKQMVAMAIENNIKNSQVNNSNETIVFEMNEMRVQSPYRACIKLSEWFQDQQCAIVQLGTVAPVNYVSVRDETHR